MGQKLHSTKPYCAPSVRSVKALSLQLRQAYTGSNSFSSLLLEIPSQATWKIFQLTLNGEQPTSMFASTSERQKRHSQVVTIACHQLCSTRASCIFTKYYLCYHLQAQLTCHDKFCKKFSAHVQTLYTRCSLRFFECLGTRLKHWT